MSAKILNLPPRHEDKGWICGCGGLNWILYANGDCLCVSCGFISTVIAVVERRAKAEVCACCESGMPKVKEDLHYEAETNSSHLCTSENGGVSGV